MDENSWIKVEPLKKKYQDWLKFYRLQIVCFMNADELRAGVESLYVAGGQSTELLLIHAMNKIEEFEEHIKNLEDKIAKLK